MNIPIDEKKKRMLELSEHDFRNNMIRTLFLSLGYSNPRETHGVDELGKDIIFTETDKLGHSRLIAIQTKKGKINMASKGSTNATNLVTQLRTALQTPVHIPGEKVKRNPDEVILCASGSINVHARDYIATELNDSRIRFLDAEEIIFRIDTHCPDVWTGITSDVYSYYNAIKKQVESINPNDIISTHVTDESYINLKLTRVGKQKVKSHGQWQFRHKIEELNEKQIIKESKDIVILSDAGFGKSTLLWRLAYLIAREAHPQKQVLPLILKAKEIIEQNILNLEAFILYCNQMAQTLTKEIHLDESTFQEGHVLLMVDAFDEIANDDFRSRVLQFIKNDLKTKYPRIRVIYTSRPREDVKGLCLNVYRIETISMNQSRKILEMVMQKKDSMAKSDERKMMDQAQKVLHRIKEIHGFELSPLLLTIFAHSIDYRYRDIPANVTELFKKFTEMMLDRWDKEKGFDEQYEYSLKDFLLKKIAHQMHEKYTTSLKRMEFKEIITNELESRGYAAESEALYDQIVDRSGLLREKEETISFSHLLLQEFFAGRGIKDIGEIGNSQLNSPWWTKCFVFYFGEHPEDADKLQKLQSRSNKKTSSEWVKNKAVGLSLQACYLSRIEVRMPIWRKLLSNLEEEMKKEMEKEKSTPILFPLYDFLFLFMIYIKDALPLSLLDNYNSFEEIWPEWNQSEIRRFLVFVALIESDRYNLIQEEDIQFDTPKLLLALHLLGFQHPSKESKKFFLRIEKNLEKSNVSKDLFGEFKEMVNPPKKAISNES